MSNESEKKLKPFELILQKELMDLDEINGVELFQVNHEDLKEIGVSITSQDGFFRNKTIKFIIKFKDTYPITPPKISCLTKIFHPNIDENGNVCLNVLKLDWNPIINLQMLILGLVLLLNEPSTNDPFNVDAANVLKNDKQKFIEINNALFYETN
ncbi:NEDD8-conjugating enzyme UBC12, putative [Plasmodium berghei]|uniref:NEDD8-conjugating enzyme UBC12, putative n=2 Tax=Plasmodium berghei TaxID=5821 RepID=A0A509ASG9_PLABA|nr:NEDD8-conjugating enzyme UBC12, putative [Plasmodium berghei ANKA]CXJ28171.1 NEDD8-conjugating enzyme UBC12, putative [Plasmodium berghei]SCM27040.1 NEDD8-conjugating enzyme UBC12, putative [Plasmodium berghei]SCN28766.1 NEDD8-conjugating enzyme UBC12, putative [Plasmodium berghei]SCO63040.1 NEDD8-conjugating enzyme UBC12, putative [Plasmodium berghei]SCO64513.1 NEDD8-conjugating enzyme UBC12, putative [Plasmodium berghei]|eukprot:XP_034424412.1 NEDD8-conjugating enzyme UBC12, putative [Plasmodium berghei ANKA]